MKRRDFLKQNLFATPLLISGVSVLSYGKNEFTKKSKDLYEGFRPLFDGKSLDGWYSVGRREFQKEIGSKGKFFVEDETIVGGQDIPGNGAYLVSEEKFGDFELMVDVKPDFPIDTGIMLRSGPAGAPGFQTLIDHRKSGGIGSFYGNGLANFHAIAWNIDATYDANGKATGLIAEDTSKTNEAVTDAKKKLLSYAAPVEEFLKAWKWDEFNTFRIRCEGKYPRLTSWINGVKICELDTAKIEWPNYDKDVVANLLGRKGHIAFEIHDNDKRLGKGRWWPGAVCRWKNIYIKEL